MPPLSLTALLALIQRSFYRRFDVWGEDFYVVEVFDDYLVAYDWMGERYYRVGYVFDAEARTVSFDDRDTWQEVVSTWTPITRAAARAEVRALMSEGDAAPSFRFVEDTPGTLTRAAAATSFREARDGQRTTAWVTTDAIARDGMILEPDGLDTTAYERNPVVLWQHGGDPQRGTVPIARCVALTRRDERQADGTTVRGWLATIEWGADPFAQLIHEQVRTGLLSMTSIGWNSRRVEHRTIEGRTVPVVTEGEMLEFSIVAIGADRNALIVERSADAARLARIEADVAALRAALHPATQPEATAPAAAPAPDATASQPEAPATPEPRAATADDYAALAADIAARAGLAVARALGRA